MELKNVGVHNLKLRVNDDDIAADYAGVMGDLNSRGFNLQIMGDDGAILTDESIKVQLLVKQESGKDLLFSDGEYKNGTYYVTIPNEVFRVEQELECQFVMSKGDDKLFSHTFTRKVAKSLLGTVREGRTTMLDLEKIMYFGEHYEQRMQELNDNADGRLKEYNENDAAKTQAYNENDAAKTATYNENDAAKTATYNANAAEKLKAYNDNDTTKTDAYNANTVAKTDAYNANDTAKTDAYNSNDIAKTAAYNENATQQTQAYNDNAAEKLKAYNDNAGNAIKTYNDNADNATINYNNNATQQTQTYNNNAAEKLESVNSVKDNVDKTKSDIDSIKQDLDAKKQDFDGKYSTFDEKYNKVSEVVNNEDARVAAEQARADFDEKLKAVFDKGVDALLGDYATKKWVSTDFYKFVADTLRKRMATDLLSALGYFKDDKHDLNSDLYVGIFKVDENGQPYIEELTDTEFLGAFRVFN